MNRGARTAAVVLALLTCTTSAPAFAEQATPINDVTGPIGDMTGDGKSDITARTGDGRLVVYPQVNGSFGAPVTISYGWNGMAWIATGRIDANGGSDVLATDGRGDLWLYANGGFDGINTLRSREQSGTWDRWNFSWGRPTITAYKVDGFDDVEILYPSRYPDTHENPIHQRFNTGLPGLGRFEDFGHETLKEPGSIIWTKFSEHPGSVIGGKYRDRLLAYEDGRLVVRVFDIATVTYRQIVLGYGWNTLDSLMIKDVNGDGIEDILGRRINDGALVVYEHRGWFDEQHPVDTYRPARVLGWGWHTVNQIS
ncbi:MAG: hypothetical protein ABIQ18_46370 [Umezawaea sp.]